MPLRKFWHGSARTADFGLDRTYNNLPESSRSPMSTTDSTITSRTLVLSALIGLGLMLLALLLALFATDPKSGFHVNTEVWPQEAQAILKASPGTPITPDQWKHIDLVLKPYGGTSYGQQPLWAQYAQHSWYWFLVLPLVTLAVRWKFALKTSILQALLIAGPSVAFISLAHFAPLVP